MLGYLSKCLPRLRPEVRFEFSGFDVSDHGVQPSGFLASTLATLERISPEILWKNRLFTIRDGDDWAFADDVKYDFIISNQVLEHVRDKLHFFKNVQHALAPEGHSVHLAPVREILGEGHLNLPLAHKINNYCALFAYIKILSVLGLGKFPDHKQRLDVGLTEFSERHADYIYFWTAYSTEAETLRAARSNGLRADFRFSIEFYRAKLRSVLGLRPEYEYRFREASFYDAALVKVLRYISCVTLVCKKSNIY